MAGQNGRVGRNTFRGPGIDNTDLALFKSLNIGERIGFMMQLEPITFGIGLSLAFPTALLVLPPLEDQWRSEEMQGRFKSA